MSENVTPPESPVHERWLRHSACLSVAALLLVMFGLLFTDDWPEWTIKVWIACLTVVAGASLAYAVGAILAAGWREYRL